MSKARKYPQMYILPDGIEHPRFKTKTTGRGFYVLCWKSAVDELKLTGLHLWTYYSVFRILIHVSQAGTNEFILRRTYIPSSPRKYLINFERELFKNSNS
jgi:hypothetical protein